MSKFIEINGETFEVIDTAKDVDACHKDWRGRRTIWDFYNRPSDVKVNIYEMWMEWARRTDCVYDMRVTSASCFMFTLGAYYVDTGTDEIIGYFRITRDHNKLYIFK